MRHFLPVTQAIVLWTMLLLLPVAICAAPQNPEECLETVNNAVETGDAAAFEELVALDSILTDAYATFLREASKPENASKIPPMLAIMLSQASSGEKGAAIQTLLLGEARAFVLNGIASGAFAGKNFNNAKKEGMLAPLFANASTGRKEIWNIGEAYPDGDGWLTSFLVHDSGNGNDYEVIGRFTRENGAVKLTSIKNMEQLFQKLQKESEALGDN